MLNPEAGTDQFGVDVAHADSSHQVPAIRHCRFLSQAIIFSARNGRFHRQAHAAELAIT